MAQGYKPKTINLDIKKSLYIEEKLEKSISFFTLLKEIPTGSQPKSVEFTPNGKYIVAALLNGKGVDVFSVYPFKKIKSVEFPEKIAKRQGFVEIAFVNRLHEMWVSQMTTGMVHRVDLKNFIYKGSIDTYGKWPKVIHISSDEKQAFVSNWDSHDISIIDIEQMKTVRKIKISGIPRGMANSVDGKYLYVCIYNNGELQKIDLNTMQVVSSLKYGEKGAMRHIVLDKEKNILFVSDMHRGSLFVIDGETDKLIKEIKVERNINTIKLSYDGKYIFLSSRGPNNPETYLKKGPEFGKVFVMDTEKLEIIDWVWGRNQPTGLAVSPFSQYVAFSDFLDNSIELYQLHTGKLNFAKPF